MRCESSTRSTTSASSPCRSARTWRRRAAAWTLCGLALSAARGAGARTPEPTLQHPPRVASYTLQAKLDAERHRVSGRGTIELFNFTSNALSELYLHLYMNAFKNDQSLFLRSPF